MIIADTVTEFRQANFGRICGYGAYQGGYNGGGYPNAMNSVNNSGSAGWAFIYCNNAVNQDTTDTVLPN